MSIKTVNYILSQASAGHWFALVFVITYGFIVSLFR